MNTTTLAPAFCLDELKLDPAVETARIVDAIHRQVAGHLRRKGAVLGISGGVDSSVTAALCVRALELPTDDKHPLGHKLGKTPVPHELDHGRARTDVVAEILTGAKNVCPQFRRHGYPLLHAMPVMSSP